jgi:S-adenosyl methyltransferase
MTQSDDWRRAATAEQMRSIAATIDPSVAHIARIQDYWLGGKDHFEADRIAGDEAIAQLSHPAADLQAAAMAGMATRLNQLMAQRVKPRSKAGVTAFFDGLDLVEPGVIRCPEWRPDHPEDAAGKSTMWGGVAEKPAGAQG